MKVYVEVLARFTTDGRLLPVAFVWEDGSRYTVDRVLDVRRRASTKAGGCGMMYTCVVEGQQIHLYHEDDERNRWFLERKTA